MSNTYLQPKLIHGIPHITVEEVFQNLGKVRLIDVRRSDEFNNELGHILGAELITLGPDIIEFLEKADKQLEIVFVCRSGARSGNVTFESQKMGFNHTMNMFGGMIEWNEKKLDIQRD